MPIALLATVGLAVVAFAVTSRASAERPDCPGTIVCPRSGELVCKDRCPARDADRADCPGQVRCPLTGELVCRDRCPLSKSEATAAQDVPPCCRGGK